MMHDEKVWQDLEAVNEVLSARLPMLALTMANPTTARCLEAERMFTEKADAAVEGMFSLQKYFMSAMFDVWRTPTDTDHVKGAVDAYLAPARKTLRDNADRLRDQKDV